MKLFITPKDIVARSAPITHISKRLKSHYKTSLRPIIDDTPFEKTIDMETTSGIVYLANSDPYQLYKDIEILRNIEKNAFQLVLSEGLEKEISFDEDANHKSLKSFIEEVEALGTCLLITDTIYDDLNVTQVLPHELKEIKGEFDTVIVNLNEILTKYDDELTTKFIINTFDRIKEGGLIIIPESTFEIMPNGRLGAEALVKILNLRIELPLHQFPKMLIASKR